LRSVETELIHADHDTPLYVFKAIVTLPGDNGTARTFEAHGDACAANTGRMIHPHLLRMAETRAVARALRFATNCGEAAREEFGDDEGAPQLASAENGNRNAPRSLKLLTAEAKVLTKYGDEGAAFIGDLKRDLKTEDLAFLDETKSESAYQLIVEQAKQWDSNATA